MRHRLFGRYRAVGKTTYVGWALIVFLVTAACASADVEYEVVLDELNEPRGLWTMADGSLCVAEAGRLLDGQEIREGSASSQADSGSVSCVDRAGERHRVIDRLPYTFYNLTGVSTGPADGAEVGGELFVLTGEGQASMARRLLRIDPAAAAPEVVADFLAFAIEIAQPDFFEEITILSNPFAMVPDPLNGRFLVTDGATGHVMAAGFDGTVKLFSDVAGHEVLTGIDRGPDNLIYVASFSQLPHNQGSGAVLQLYPDGSFTVAADNLTTPIDLAFDSAGRLYVIEFINEAATDGQYRGTTGRLLRLEPQGDGWAGAQVLVEGMAFPTALFIDGDDRVYVSLHGAFSAAGSGLVLRFDDLARRDSTRPPIRYADDTR